MEHIKKAVQIAEEALQAGAVPYSSATTEAKTLPYSAVGRASARSLADRITYTDTRTIPISPETLREKRVILGTQSDVIASAYKMLRTQVLQRMRENEWNVLGITSCRPGEGKSLTSINLAISMAHVLDRTVLLVDVDLRRPQIHEYLGYTPDRGLNDYLINDVPLKDILFNPGIERLVVLPGREPLANSSEMLSSPKMEQLVEDLKTRYPTRMLIFDLPPLLATDDALAFSPYIDAVLLVLERGKTDKDDLKRAAELLSETNLLGTVLNKSDEKNPGYY